MASDSAPRWTPHPDLDESLLPVTQKLIDSIPPTHLLPPRHGEIYDVPDDCLERLQDYAFSQGFAVTTGSCGQAGNPRKYFQCIHHGKETKNWRHLDEHVDTKEQPTDRQREHTHIKGLGCKWSVSLSYKRKNRSQPNDLAWILCVKEENIQQHSHPLQANSLSYEAHCLRNPDYAKAIDIAKAHRLSKLSYTQSDRVLSNTRKDLDEDLHIKRKKYYRLVPSTTRKHEDVLKGFLAALEELETDDLISKTRYEYELNAAGVPSKKILKQVCKKPNRTNPRSLKSGLIVTCKSFVNQSANGYLGVFYGYSAEEVGKAFLLRFRHSN